MLKNDDYMDQSDKMVYSTSNFLYHPWCTKNFSRLHLYFFYSIAREGPEAAYHVSLRVLGLKPKPGPILPISGPLRLVLIHRKNVKLAGWSSSVLVILLIVVFHLKDNLRKLEFMRLASERMEQTLLPLG